MSLQTLPSDILLDILQHVFWEDYNHDDFKQRLYLLAVFRRLRTIALPKAYSCMYISPHKCGDSKIQSYTNKHSKAFANCIDTNADIIALSNCTHMVKSAKISATGLYEPYAEIHKIIMALRYCANSWPNITKLEIYMMYKNSLILPSKTHSTQVRCLGKKYSQELINIMPYVTEFTFINALHGCVVNEFYSLVADEYANQLVKLTNTDAFDNKGSHKLKVMKCLDLSMDYYNKLPQVNSHTLVDLHIDNIPANVSWAPFLDSREDTVVVFSCLKRLWLGFIYDEDINCDDVIPPEIVLKFPELSSLKIISDSEFCPFFRMAKFPNEIDAINIQAPQELLKQLKDAGIPTAKKVTMCS